MAKALVALSEVVQDDSGISSISVPPLVDGLIEISSLKVGTSKWWFTRARWPTNPPVVKWIKLIRSFRSLFVEVNWLDNSAIVLYWDYTISYSLLYSAINNSTVEFCMALLGISWGWWFSELYGSLYSRLLLCTVRRGSKCGSSTLDMAPWELRDEWGDMPGLSESKGTLEMGCTWLSSLQLATKP